MLLEMHRLIKVILLLLPLFCVMVARAQSIPDSVLACYCSDCLTEYYLKLRASGEHDTLMLERVQAQPFLQSEGLEAHIASGIITLEGLERKTVVAIKTNLLYDLATLANFSIEVPLGKRNSVLYYHQFPWWRFGEGHNEFCVRFLSIGVESRWWFNPGTHQTSSEHVGRDRLTGHFIGIYAESGKWDFERRRDLCYQGEHWSAGLSYGYAMPVGRRLNLEFSVSAGYASIPHRGYEPAADYSQLYHLPEKDGRWNYIGPTKLQVSLVVPITGKLKRGGKI